ncbi:MAG TPA: DNA polymerase III subunit gamma/tau, partial [Roseiflexaceae bacterium]|nr:DNA polymerase III subunit gamma/tau [Roseiflexaceae bacterium]
RPPSAEPRVPPPAAPPLAEDPFLAHGAQERAPGPAASGAPAEAPADTPAAGLPETAHEEEPGAIESANADAATFEYIESIWSQIVRDVRALDRMFQAVLNSGVRPIDVRGNELVLEVDNEFLITRFEAQKKHTLERVLKKHTGADYTVQCVVKEQRRENPNVLREQIRTSRRDPLVKAALNIFDADIIGVEDEKE